MAKDIRFYSMSKGLQEQLKAVIAEQMKGRMDSLSADVDKGEIDSHEVAILVELDWLSSHKDPRLTLIPDDAE
jgi:hypothetical protein